MRVEDLTYDTSAMRTVERFRLLLESAPDAMMIFSPNGRVLAEFVEGGLPCRTPTVDEP